MTTPIADPLLVYRKSEARDVIRPRGKPCSPAWFDVIIERSGIRPVAITPAGVRLWGAADIERLAQEYGQDRDRVA